VATATDPLSGVTTYAYDACCDRLSSVTLPGSSLFVTSYTYDALGNRKTVKKQLDATKTATTQYFYDGLNRLTKVTDPLNNSTTYKYDENLIDGVGLDPTYSDMTGGNFDSNAVGAGVEVTNAAGEKTATFSDGAGRVVVSVSASSNETFTAYDAVVGGLVETATTDALNNVTRSRQDGVGGVRTSVDATGMITTRTFDATGNLLSLRDPNAVGEDCHYDGNGARTNCTDTQGDKTIWEYDAALNQTAVTTGSTADGTLVRKTTAYDFRNRRKTYTDGVPSTTKWTYDGNSNVLTITDGETRVTTYTYDSRNLKLTETFPDSTGPTDKVTYAYDAGGRLSTRTDQGGAVLTYGFDDADRLHTKTDQQGKVDTLNYDAVGRFHDGTSQRYGTGVTRTYDPAGRLQEEDLTVPGVVTPYKTLYDYDELDRLKTLTYPDSVRVTRAYTNRSQLDTITLSTSGQLAKYTYDNGGRIQTLTPGNGLVETRSYRADNTLASISTPNIGDFTYTYDAQKRRKTEGGSATNGAQTLGYDNEGRLTSWGNGTATQNWSLSAVGDWNTTTRSGTTETRVHSTAHAVTSVGTETLSYDKRGSLVARAGTSLSWDFENRLMSYTANGTTTSYLYDVLGRKVSRTVGTTTTTFTYAGDQVIEEFQVGFFLKYYLGETIDRPVAFEVGAPSSTIFYYSANGLGSIAAVTSGSGTVLERYRYNAYGARTVMSASGTILTTSVTQVGFTGRYHDAVTGLIDFRFRLNDPQMGRFISRDDKYRDGMSLYGAYFVPNRRDPTGHKTLRVPYTDLCVEVSDAEYENQNSGSNEVIKQAVDSGQFVRCPPDDPGAGDPSPLPDDDISKRGQTDPLVGIALPAPTGPISSMNCNELRDRIAERLDELHKRYQDLREDVQNLPPTGTMSIEGHQQQFRAKQANLRELLEAYDKQNCGGGLPCDAWKWATMPAPEPAGVPGQVIKMDTLNVSAKTAAAIGGGYLFYRGIRMLPSLIPPLWPTIPANAICP
jgi:RHS repeat-associated protein